MTAHEAEDRAGEVTRRIRRDLFADLGRNRQISPDAITIAIRLAVEEGRDIGREEADGKSAAHADEADTPIVREP